MPNRFTRLAWHLTQGTRRVLPMVPPMMPNRSLALIEAKIDEGTLRHDALVRFVCERALDPDQIRLGVDARGRALKVFSDLGVWDTERNNGVLIYVLMADHAVELVADRAAARQIDAAQWRQVCETLARAYRERRYVEGALEAVGAVNDLLASRFPLMDASESDRAGGRRPGPEVI